MPISLQVPADCMERTDMADTVEEGLPRYGHAIIIRRVRAIAIRADGHPLLYWHGAFRQIVQKRTN